MYRVKVLIALLLVAMPVDAFRVPSDATDASDITSQIGNVIGRTLQMVEQCGNIGITTCLKERALTYLDSISGSIEIADGVTLRAIHTEKHETQNVSKPSLPEEPRARETAIDNLLMDRVTKFLSSHKLEFKIPKSTVSETSREIDADEGRKKKKKKKKLLMSLFMLLKFKALLLMPLFLKAVALVSFKALVIGKIALVISSLIIIKKFLEGKPSSETYEFVAHPQHSHKHTSSIDYEHGPYRRQMVEDANGLPYSAYAGGQQILFGNE